MLRHGGHLRPWPSIFEGRTGAGQTGGGSGQAAPAEQTSSAGNGWFRAGANLLPVGCAANYDETCGITARELFLLESEAPWVGIGVDNHMSKLEDRTDGKLGVARRIGAKVACFAAAVALVASPAHGQLITGELIPETTALRHGLHRRWVSQVQMDLARDRLTHVTLNREVLCVQTRNGLAQVIEAENGGSRWVAQIGREGYPSSELAANEDYVAAMNGVTLYVLNLATGKPLFQRKLESAPFAAPVLDATRVYVPLFNGMISTYQLEQPRGEPTRFRSIGEVVAKPILTPKSLVWGTTRGFAYACEPGRTKVRFQLETQGEILSPMGYREGVIYVTSRDGYAYALAEANGQMLWRFSAGSPIAHEPVVVENSVYLFPEAGGMFAVSADRGTELWRRAGIKQFLAHRRADPAYPDLAPALYVADTSGNTLTLDPANGAILDTLRTDLLTLKMTNTLNDRIYLSTPMGMIQCLHHPQVAEPLWHAPPTAAAAKAKPAPPARSGATAEAPAEGNAPDEGEAPAAEPDPFKQPAEETTDEAKEQPAAPEE